MMPRPWQKSVTICHNNDHGDTGDVHFIEWQAKDVDEGWVSGGTVFVKNSMWRDDWFLHSWVPELPCLHAFGIANEDALPPVQLECLLVLLAHQHVGQAAKDAEVQDIWVSSILEGLRKEQWADGSNINAITIDEEPKNDLYGQDTPIDTGTGNNSRGNNIWTQLTSTNVVAYHYIITCNNQCLLLRHWHRVRVTKLSAVLMPHKLQLLTSSKVPPPRMGGPSSNLPCQVEIICH